MSYFRGKYYTYQGEGYFYLFNLGSVPQEIVDAFVVMRYTNMAKKEVQKAEKFAIKECQGNFGCDALSAKHGKITGEQMLRESIQFHKELKLNITEQYPELYYEIFPSEVKE